MRKILLLFCLPVLFMCCKSGEQAPASIADTTGTSYAEQHRPRFHFSPKEKWMNDPNGLVFYKGEYHLFYQYHPDGLTWGPMHWGHAISEDLIHWEHLPIALYPDSLGLIFSGSAVVDANNTSGFGTSENPALVAIFTYHSMEKEKAGRTDYQYQGIAYSTDNGRTWTKYQNNPVLSNQGIKDFRDPKVFWHAESKKWVMVLAVKDHVELWGSPDLKAWRKLSDFGHDYGAHGGVWECPDLVYLNADGENSGRWVLIVSINPGGPNGGSATQYFVGDFDGETFSPDTDRNTILWIDHGPDNYAGVTYANAPDNRKIFLGWMSNWAYAQEVPTSPWRSAMTLPRDLSLVEIDDRHYVRSMLSPETSRLTTNTVNPGNIDVDGSVVLKDDLQASSSRISGNVAAQDFTITLFNDHDQELVIGFDRRKNVYYIERGKSGINTFSKNFKERAEAPRVSTQTDITFTIVADVSSVEVFFDNGLSVLTALYFPKTRLHSVKLSAPQPTTFENVQVQELKSIWQ